jgi:hypothetical protein
MPDIPQLVATIDSRLADIAAEISALDAAKAELSAPRSGGQAPASTEAPAFRCLTEPRDDLLVPCGASHGQKHALRGMAGR